MISAGGIAPETLSVCIVGPNDECVDLSGNAEPHGVTHVALSAPITDKDAEVLARVEDKAGNVTEVRRTVGWLLDSPTPSTTRRPRWERGGRRNEQRREQLRRSR